MLTLISDKKLLPEDKDEVLKVPFTYFYGNIEKDNETDIFYVKDDENIFEKGNNLSSGVFPATCDDLYCMFYLWHSPQGFHGLACYTVDDKANDYALKCYRSKTSII